MSNISNRHSINVFVSGKSQALTGQRLSKVGWKSSKNNPAKFDKNICVSVPRISGEEIVNHVEVLIPYIRTMIENTQDSIVRSLYESSDGTRNSISDDEIGIASCVKFMEAELSGGRLNSGMLENWFTQNAHDILYVTVAEKLGFEMNTPDQEKKVEQVLSGYKGLIISLAGGKTLLNDAQKKAIRRVLELVDSQDDVSERLIARLDSMDQKKPIEELLEL